MSRQIGRSITLALIVGMFTVPLLPQVREDGAPVRVTNGSDNPVAVTVVGDPDARFCPRTCGTFQVVKHLQFINGVSQVYIEIPRGTRLVVHQLSVRVGGPKGARVDVGVQLHFGGENQLVPLELTKFSAPDEDVWACSREIRMFHENRATPESSPDYLIVFAYISNNAGSPYLHAFVSGNLEPI
ncbi:MAG: hypothetical protein WBX15_15210 [Thermoanaerobaculia bacterium]